MILNYLVDSPLLEFTTTLAAPTKDHPFRESLTTFIDPGVILIYRFIADPSLNITATELLKIISMTDEYKKWLATKITPSNLNTHRFIEPVISLHYCSILNNFLSFSSELENNPLYGDSNLQIFKAVEIPSTPSMLGTLRSSRNSGMPRIEHQVRPIINALK